MKVKNLDKHAGKVGSMSHLAPRVYLDFFVFTMTIKMWVQNCIKIRKKSSVGAPYKKITLYFLLHKTILMAEQFI